MIVDKTDFLSVSELYFEWLRNHVSPNRNDNVLVLEHIHDVPFWAVMDMDKNRIEHANELRNRFIEEESIDNPVVIYKMNMQLCSVFEVMVALALKCEESIMYDPEYGNRASLWFEEMMDSLGLNEMNNATYDKGVVDNILYRFLTRHYEPNGKGGLFTISNPREDMRKVDIWYQAMWYLSERYEKGDFNNAGLYDNNA